VQRLRLNVLRCTRARAVAPCIYLPLLLATAVSSARPALTDAQVHAEQARHLRGMGSERQDIKWRYVFAPGRCRAGRGWGKGQQLLHAKPRCSHVEMRSIHRDRTGQLYSTCVEPRFDARGPRCRRGTASPAARWRQRTCPVGCTCKQARRQLQNGWTAEWQVRGVGCLLQLGIAHQQASRPGRAPLSAAGQMPLLPHSSGAQSPAPSA